MNTKAIVFTGPDAVDLQSVDVPEPKPDEVLIKTSFTAVSPGTELRVLAGQQPGMPEFPLIPGYALAGIVIASGENSPLLPGTRVFCSGTSRVEGITRCWGAHIGHAIRRAAEVFSLPPTVSLRDAPLAALAGISQRGVALSRPQNGETVVVVGLGPIGLLSARLHALSGARVIGADLRGDRAELLRRGGLQAVSGEDIFGQLRALIPGGANVIVDATGVPSVVEQAITLAKDVPFGETEQVGARYVLQGSYPDTIPLPYQAAFMKELTFLLPRNLRPRDVQTVLEHLRQKNLIVHDLVSETFPPGDAAHAYALLRQPDSGLHTVLFEWSRF